MDAGSGMVWASFTMRSLGDGNQPGRERTLARAGMSLTRMSKADDKFRGLLEAAPDAMIICSRDGKIVLVNAQAEKLFGYPREELLGKSVDLLVPQRLRTQHSAHRTGYVDDPH